MSTRPFLVVPSRIFARLVTIACACVLLLVSTRAHAAPFVVYDDALSSSYVNASFSATVDFANTSSPHAGTKDISVTYTSGFGGLFLFAADASTPDITQTGGVEFWIRKDAAAGPLHISLQDSTGGTQIGNAVAVDVPGSSWTKVDVTLDQFGVTAASGRADSIMIQYGASPLPSGLYYFDSITLLDAPVSDAGTDAGVDAGEDAGVDAGPAIDAGSDSGAPDAGVIDAGKTDAGEDAGSTTLDSGLLADSGTTSTDGGKSTDDAGAHGNDAGNSSSPDASADDDAGLDDVLLPTDDGGCGCVIGMEPLATGWGAVVPLIIGALAVVRRRKRR